MMIIDHHRIKTRVLDASVQDSLAPGLTSPVVSVRDKSTLTPAAATLSATLSESLKFEIENVAAVSETTDASLTAPNVTVTDPAPIQPQASNLSVSYTESANANSTVPPYDRDFFITDLDAVSDQCVNGRCESIQKADDEVDMNASNAEGKQLEVTWSTGDYRSQNNSVSWTVRIKALDGSGSIIDSAEFKGTTGNRNYVLSFTAPQGTQQIEVERFIQIIRRDSCRFDGDCARYEAHLLAPVSVTEV